MGQEEDQDDEDQRLWRALCAEVKPISVSSHNVVSKNLIDDEQKPDTAALRPRAQKKTKPLASSDIQRLHDWSGAPMQPKTPRFARPVREVPRFYAHMEGRMQHRFRTGKITPEAELDLHGLTEARAAELFTRFFYRARQRGLRCVLVVTGKGQGVLQRGLAGWLEVPSVKQSLIGVAPMPSHKGGNGAFCLYLRK